MATGLEKVSFHSDPKEKEMPKNAQPTTQFHLSHTLTVMLKILQVRLQQYVKRELPDVQAGFRKGRETRFKLPTSIGSSKKQESSRKISTSVLLTMPKTLCGSQQTTENS